MMTSLSTQVLLVTSTLILLIVMCDVITLVHSSSQRSVTGVKRRSESIDSVISDGLKTINLTSVKTSNLTSVMSNGDSTKNWTSPRIIKGFTESRTEQLEHRRMGKVKQEKLKKVKPKPKVKTEKHTFKNKKEVDEEGAPPIPIPSDEHRREAIQTFKHQMLQVLGLKSEPKPRGRVHVPPHMIELYRAYAAANRRRAYETGEEEGEGEGERENEEEEEDKRTKKGGKKRTGQVTAFRRGSTIRSFLAHVHGKRFRCSRQKLVLKLSFLSIVNLISRLYTPYSSK